MDIISMMKPGENTALGYNVTLLIRDVEEKLTKKNTPYVTLTLTDGERDIVARKWDTAISELPVSKGSLANFAIAVSLYNGEPSYTINFIGPPSPNADISQYLPMAPEDPAEGFNELMGVAEGLNDEALKAAVKQIFETYRDKLLIWGAAKSIHHNVRGGLIWHLLRMVRAAKSLATVYSIADTDILFAGTILHDIGKVKELVTDEMGQSVYTTEGMLFGHTYLGMELVRQACIANQVSPQKTDALLHVIAAHHGKREWGAVAIPSSEEAMLVHYLDMIDSRTYVFEQEYKELQSGEIAQQRNMFLDNTCAYRS